ncbi:MAG: 3-phosphoshikimate 1-carboxyvinyltransferase [Planctomycetota bacterium]
MSRSPAAPPSLKLPTAWQVTGRVAVPGSKSLSNRAMLLAYLASGATRLTGVLDSDDTRVMFDALRRLGVKMTGSLKSGRLTLHGCGGRPPVRAAELFIGNSGTSTRFLAAALCLAGGRYVLDGTPRMRERPIGDLIEPLAALGAEIACAASGCPPVTIGAARPAPGAIAIRGDTSSQFLSGLLMLLPGLVATGRRRASEVRIDGALVSRPYVEMTLALMARFGVRIGAPRGRTLRWRIPARKHAAQAIYRCGGGSYPVEPDASNASYFLAAAAVTGGRVTVPGLGAASLQGDVKFADAVLANMGCGVSRSARGLTVTGPAAARSAAGRKAIAAQPFLTPGLKGIDVDLTAMPDMAQTLAVLALFAAGPTTIRGVANLRVKETDRLAALQTELTRIGARVTVGRDWIRIDPGARGYRPTVVATYDDHRMAMSFALAGLRIPGMRIADPGCVAKTFPDFFDRWRGVVKKKKKKKE